MLDSNWETINGPIATQIELANAANQINVMESLILFLLAHKGPTGNGNPPMPDETAIMHLHYAGTLFLLSAPGRYRNVPVQVENLTTKEVIYRAPEWQAVEMLMKKFFRDLSSVWTSGDPLDVAAFALWCINWIHPYRNGNGRTARAFAYACLCIRLGTPLPGSPTVLEQVMANRGEYESALRTADQSYAKIGIPDLSEMKGFLHRLVQIQIASIRPQTPPMDGATPAT